MEKIKMQPTRPEDALLTDAFADFLEKCRAKNLSEKTLNIYTVHFKFFKEYLSDPDKKASDITEDTLEGFILAVAVHNEPDSHRTNNAHAQVKRMQAGQRVCKGGGDAAR